MSMHSPIPHDLTTYDNQFDFQKNGFCPHQWEISVPQKNCIIWGVVLSYLRSADFSAPGKFEERLSRLTENAFDPETVKASILEFNPFFNIHKCFFDETLQKISQSFRKVLSKNRPSSAPKTVAYDLQLISTLLKTNILIVDLGSKNLHLVTPSDGYSTDLAAITLFCREYTSQDGKKPVLTKRFTFSLNKDLCWELRRDALQIILESSEIRGVVEREIQLLCEKKEKKVNILIALLKKDLTHVVSELYDSPYILTKLADAGFETDPRVQDADGFSAFYYAVQSNDNNIVYSLYRYESYNCSETENTFRDPNPCIISNLSKLKEILNGDYARSNNFEELGDCSRVAYQDLLRFHDFLTEVTRGINEIPTQNGCSSLEEAEKLKQTILLILDKYEAFFFVGQLDSPREPMIENYTRHKAYYENFDFSVALLFFDNILLLKSVLKSTRDDLYSELESSFLLSAIANKYFTGDAEKRKQIQDLCFELDSNNLSIISLLERLNLREKVKKFSISLGEKKLAEEDIVQCIPQLEITESYFQELKDEFLFSRLDHYLKTALESTSDGLKLKFAIQRALQVVGECIIIEKEHPSSVRHLLRKCMTDDTLEDLKKARHTLLHLKSFQFPLKFETEEDDSLFTSIQSEIRSIRASFEKVFDIQKFRFMEFLINRGLESARKIHHDAGIDMHTVVQCVEIVGKQLQKMTLEFNCLLDQNELDGHCVSVPGINEFSRRLTGFASKVEVEQIRGEIPPAVTTRLVAIEKLEQDLERRIAIDVDRFDSLFLETEDLFSIKKEYEKYLQNESEADSSQTSKRSSLLRKIKTAPSPVNTLDLILAKIKVSDSEINALYEAIPFSDNAKSTLNSLIEISKTPCGNSLANLLNRIEHLHEICIDEQYDIRFLWERAVSSKAKQHLVYKIVQRYFREPSFQASLEMLLFDCVGILKKHEGQKKKRKSKEENNEDQKKKRTEENDEDQKKKRAEENDDQKKKRTEGENYEGQKKRCKEQNGEYQKKKRTEGKDDEDQKKRAEEENDEYQKKKRTEQENDEDQKKKRTEEEMDEDQKKKRTEEEMDEDQKKKRTEKENNEDLKKRAEEENDEYQKKKRTEKENDEDQKKKEIDEDQKKKRTEKENDEDQKKKRSEEGNDEYQKKERTEEENEEDKKKRTSKEDNDENQKKRTQVAVDNNEDQKNKRRSREENIDQSFWLKDSYLFNGIDVRNVLAHGDPLLESIGNILDPKDLPSELVKKSLQLLEDRLCIEALCNLWQKAKQSDKNPDRSSEWCKLKNSIVCCKRWQEYSKLLAEDPKDSETCQSLVSFLKENVDSQKGNTLPKKKKRRSCCNSESSES